MISVIVAVQNVEKSLSKCLHSIKGQTYRKIQVILLDNGSIDKSGEILYHSNCLNDAVVSRSGNIRIMKL